MHFYKIINKISFQATENFSTCIQEVHEEIVKIYTDHKLTIQPYVIINGPLLSGIKSAYVIIGQFKYQVSTASLAVDLCFQCMKIFHTIFPIPCNHVWQFIEKHVYEFTVKELYSGVTTLIEKLQKL